MGRWSFLPEYRGMCRTYRLRVRREKIGYVNAIFESYGHMARVQTEDIERGVLACLVPEDSDALFRKVAEELRNAVDLKWLPDESRRPEDATTQRTD